MRQVREAARLAMVLLVVWAAPARAARTLSLDEALALARANNADLKAARARLDEAQGDVEASWSALLPKVSLQGRYTHNNKEVSLALGKMLDGGVLGLAGVLAKTSSSAEEKAALGQFESQLSAASSSPIVIQKEEQLDGNLNATVPLLALPAYPALRAVKDSYAAQQASYSATEASVLLAVAETYFAAAGADELLRARQDAVSLASQTLSTAKARVEAGAATRVDEMRAEVALVRAKEAVTEALDTEARAYRALGTLMGTEEPVRVVPAASEAAPLPPSETLVRQALTLRPEIAANERLNEAAKLSAKAQAWGWAPTLAAFGQAHVGNYESFSGDDYAWAAGIELDWSIYDGGMRRAQEDIDEARWAEGQARIEALRDSIRDGVVDARRAIGTKESALKAAGEEVDLAQATLKLVRAQYDAGQATQLDLLQAQDSLVSAEVARASARFGLSLATIDLQRETGTFPAGG